MVIEYENYYSYSEDILVRRFWGIVNADEIISSWDYLLNKNLLINVKGVVNDLSQAKLDIDLDSFKKLMAYLKENKTLKSIKLAVVTDSPGNIVFPFIAERTEKELNVKPFSTISAAVDWILV